MSSKILPWQVYKVTSWTITGTKSKPSTIKWHWNRSPDHILWQPQLEEDWDELRPTYGWTVRTTLKSNQTQKRPRYKLQQTQLLQAPGEAGHVTRSLDGLLGGTFIVWKINMELLLLTYNLCSFVQLSYYFVCFYDSPHQEERDMVIYTPNAPPVT